MPARRVAQRIDTTEQFKFNSSFLQFVLNMKENHWGNAVSRHFSKSNEDQIGVGYWLIGSRYPDDQGELKA